MKLAGSTDHRAFISAPGSRALPRPAKVSVIFFFSSAVFLAYDTVPEAFIYPVSLRILLGTAVFALIVPSTIADTFPMSGPVVSGKRARLYSGQAAAPKKAPLAVKRAI